MSLKKPYLWLMAAAVIIVAVGGLMLTQYLINKGKMSHLSATFNTLEHPQDSILIHQLADLGDFGEGAHCEYFSGELRQSSLTPDQLKRAYQKASDSWIADLSMFYRPQRKLSIITADRLSEDLKYLPFDRFVPAWEAQEKKDNLYLVYISIIEDGSCYDFMRGMLGIGRR